MASPSTTQTTNHEGTPSDSYKRRMIANAIRYARAELQLRIAHREILKELDRRAEIEEGSAVPPAAFRTALRQPAGSRRKVIHVSVDGKRVRLLLNPQGKVDPEREQWLWDWLRARVRDEGAT